MNYFHPASVLVFFIAMTVPLMLVSSPVFTAVSLAGAVAVFLHVRNGRGTARELSGYLAVFLVMSALNPLFVHRGSTPLFFLNGKAITLEALAYGINSSLRLVTAVIWFRGFSVVMTNERLFCLIGKLSPKISSALAMTVRFVPDLLAQGRKISSYSMVSGQKCDYSLIGRVKNAMTVFSALITWSIESAVQTADSMKARGFELGGRTAYSRFSFAAEDALLMLLGAASCTAAFVFSKKMNVIFYPTLNYSHDPLAAAIVGILTAAAYLYPIVFAICINRRREVRRK